MEYKERYQDCNKLTKAYRWLRWVPYAYLRGIYWYLHILSSESLTTCMSISIGMAQAPRCMNYVYSMDELFGVT